MVLLPRIKICLSILPKTGWRNVKTMKPMVRLFLNHIPACSFSSIVNNMNLTKTKNYRTLLLMKNTCIQRMNFSTEINDEYEIDCKILSNVLAENSEIYLLDVRTIEELAEEGKIPGAVNVPLHEVESALQSSDGIFEKLYGAEKPDSDDENIVFYCRAGVRSLKALAIARGLGYGGTKHLAGGFMAWTDFHQKS